MFLTKGIFIGNTNKGKDGLQILRAKHEGKINLEKYASKILFDKLIYYHKQPLFKALLDGTFKNYLKDDVPPLIKIGLDGFVEDLAASVYKSLFISGNIREELDSMAIKICRDIIINNGYKELTNESLDNDIILKAYRESKNGKSYGEIQNVLMIAGCQNEEMLERRLKTVIDIIPRFRTNLTIVVSGGNPIENNASIVDIVDESIRMFNRLQELIQIKNVKLPYSFAIEREGKSCNTKENIKETIHRFVSDKDKVYNFFIVSSTFHLIRLGNELESLLSKIFTDEKDFEDEQRMKIDSIVLIGAEKLETRFVPVLDGDYMKLMFVDIYKNLFAYRK